MPVMPAPAKRVGIYQVKVTRTESQDVWILADCPESARTLVELGNGDGNRPVMTDWRVTEVVLINSQGTGIYQVKVKGARHG